MRAVGVVKTTVWRWQEYFAEAGARSLVKGRSKPPSMKPLAEELKLRVVEKTMKERPANGHALERALDGGGDGHQPYRSSAQIALRSTCDLLRLLNNLWDQMMLTRRFVTLCYRAILGREPENQSVVDDKLRGSKTAEEVLQEFLESPEYLVKNNQYANTCGLTATAQRFLTTEVIVQSAQLETERPIPRLQFDEACRLAIPKMEFLPFGSQLEYLAYHRDRFYELNNIAAHLVRGLTKPRILDVGMSINSVILRKLLPDASIAICDRPGYVLRDGQPFELYSIDLTSPDLSEKTLSVKFDVILFTEVLEHLLANPVRVLNFFLRHLHAHGSLVVTTPNFFSGGNLRALELGENPQPIFPAHLRRGQEGEFHVREYSMSELLLFAEEANGVPTAFFYSACWEDKTGKVLPERRKNLCAIVRPNVQKVSG